MIHCRRHCAQNVKLEFRLCCVPTPAYKTNEVKGQTPTQTNDALVATHAKWPTSVTPMISDSVAF